MNFESILNDKKTRIHLSGIGGVSMKSLARYLSSRGVPLQGSDRERSPAVIELEAMGIPISIGHSTGNAQGADLVIRSAAIHDDNPDIEGARALGIPVIERAEAWGHITATFKNRVCVAGTHGKTSTTSMISAVALDAGLDPMIMVGGDFPMINGSFRDGRGETSIAETCEYMNQFLNFSPTIAIILNIDMDHFDFFKSEDDLISSFSRFARLTPEDGAVVVNGQDKMALQAVEGLNRNIITFGWDSSCTVYPSKVTSSLGVYSCDIMHGEQVYSSITLSVPGKHNLSNALAAAAAAIYLEIDGEDFARGIGHFRGTGRRFELKKQWRGALVYDEYAHHPSEIKVSIQTARSMCKGRVISVFQPHTYSRTASLMHEFAEALDTADLVILCPVYAARELPIEGVTAEKMASLCKKAQYAPSLEAAAQKLGEIAQPGDLILLTGAGDVWKTLDMLV